MKAPKEKSIGYTAVTIISAIVVMVILNVLMASVMGVSMYGGMGSGSSLFGSRLGSTTINSGDGGSITINGAGGALGGLAAIAAQAEKAGQQMEQAEKSGDQQAAAAAAGNVLAAVLGGGDKVESLAPDQIKSFLPATLGGMKQTSISAERNGAMSMQISEAKATYVGGSGKSIDLEVNDMGSTKGLMGLASWVNVEQDKQTGTGYEKTYKQGENMVHEEWDNVSKNGEYSVIVAGRFAVKAGGSGVSIDELKSAVGGINLSGLAALKNSGVTKP
jgi:hypothetical protein